MSDAPVLLLVGGTGFVGAHMAPALRRAFADHRHVMLTREAETVAEGWSAENGNLLDPASIESVVARLKPRIVVHLAAQASIDVAVNAAEATWRVNFGGTFALASALARHAPGGTVLFTSSAEVYGRSFVLGKATEDTPTQPANAYAASKLAAEHALAQVLPPETRLIVTRSFNHTGPGQDERFALPSFAAQIVRIEAGLLPPVVRVGDLSAERDFLHVSDVVDAYIRLLTMKPSQSRILVNVSSGQGYRIGDLLHALCDLARVPVRVETDPARMRPSDIPSAVGDPARLKQLTGWQPKHSVEDTLVELIEWWRARIGAQAAHLKP